MFKPSPKDTFRQAQQASLIDYAQALIDGLDLRHELSHDYDGNKFEETEDQFMKQVLPAIAKLWHFFKEEYGDGQAKLID